MDCPGNYLVPLVFIRALMLPSANDAINTLNIYNALGVKDVCISLPYSSNNQFETDLMKVAEHISGYIMLNFPNLTLHYSDTEIAHRFHPKYLPLISWYRSISTTETKLANYTLVSSHSASFLNSARVALLPRLPFLPGFSLV